MSTTNARTDQSSEAASVQGSVCSASPRRADKADSIGPAGPALRGPLVLAGVLLVLGLACIPLDGPVSDAAIAFREHTLGGDVERELGALQQFGQGAMTLLAAWAIWLVDPKRRRRLLDWVAAVVLAALIAYPAKMLIGRPRPKFHDPGYFSGPFGAYPLGEEVGVRHGWEVWADISSDLWSMPSSHTVYAVVAAMVLAAMYPRLRPLAVVMAILVGVSRVLFGAHYPSDVLIGASIGVVAGACAMRRYLGVRTVDAVWRRLVDRDAEPALAGVLEHESRLRA